jgi:hypothetical protein
MSAGRRCRLCSNERGQPPGMSGEGSFLALFTPCLTNGTAFQGMKGNCPNSSSTLSEVLTSYRGKGGRQSGELLDNFLPVVKIYENALNRFILGDR